MAVAIGRTPTEIENVRAAFVMAGKPAPTDEQIDKMFDIVELAQLAGNRNVDIWALIKVAADPNLLPHSPDMRALITAIGVLPNPYDS